MKKVQNYLLSLSILILVISCDKECGDANISELRGDWEWIESTGGFAGITITPETEMATQSLKINKTHYEAYRNDSLMFRSEYDIVITPDSSWGTNTFLEFETGGSVAFIQQGTSLTLYELCADCFMHSYERK